MPTRGPAVPESSHGGSPADRRLERFLSQMAGQLEAALEEMRELSPEQATALRPELDELLETFALFDQAFEKRAKQIEAERN